MHKVTGTLLFLLLLPLLAGPAPARGAVVVLRVEPGAGGAPLEVFATLPSNAAFFQVSQVRQGICVFVDLPLNQDVQLLYYRPSRPEVPVLHQPLYPVRDAGPWSGPQRVRVTRGPLGVFAKRKSLPTAPVQVAAAFAAGFAQPDPAKPGAALEGDLETIEYLAARAKTNPVARDAVFWSLQSLSATKAGDAAARRRIAVVERGLRTREDTADLFHGEAAAARFKVMGKLASERAGKTTDVSPDELDAVIIDGDTLMTARDAALRINGHKGYEISGRAWRVAREHAVDPASPLLYAANYACAKSPNLQHQEVVLESIRDGEPSRYSAGVAAASVAGLERARPAILARSRRPGGLEDTAMKRSTIDYLGTRTDPESLNVLGDFLKSEDLEIKLTAASRLRALQQSRRIRLPSAVGESLTRVERSTLQTYLRRPATDAPRGTRPSGTRTPRTITTPRTTTTPRVTTPRTTAPRTTTPRVTTPRTTTPSTRTR